MEKAKRVQKIKEKHKNGVYYGLGATHKSWLTPKHGIPNAGPLLGNKSLLYSEYKFYIQN